MSGIEQTDTWPEDRGRGLPLHRTSHPGWWIIAPTPVIGLDWIDSLHLQPPWMQYARCVGTDPEVFFPERGGRDGVVARRICDGCPVRELCLEWATPQPELAGIWGGSNERERQQERGRRQRGHH